jgi:hypothetical protein
MIYYATTNLRIHETMKTKLTHHLMVTLLCVAFTAPPSTRKPARSPIKAG